MTGGHCKLQWKPDWAMRWAALDADSVQRFAKELVALQPDVILSHVTPTTVALLQQTRAIPIIFVWVSDPVGSGFVASLARPGGNATGFTPLVGSLGGKWVELSIEADPIYQTILIAAEKAFWRAVKTGETPALFDCEPPKPRIEAVRVVDMNASNSWAEFAALFCRTRAAHLDHDAPGLPGVSLAESGLAFGAATLAGPPRRPPSRAPCGHTFDGGV